MSTRVGAGGDTLLRRSGFIMENDTTNPAVKEPEFLSQLSNDQAISAAPAVDSPAVDSSWQSTLADTTPTFNMLTDSQITPLRTDSENAARINGTTEESDNETRFFQTSASTSSARPMQIGRFLFGLLFSGIGLTLMLLVAVGTIKGFGMHGRLSLPAIGLSMIMGLMLLGGGFGVMATAAPRFDDNEFNRQMIGDMNRIERDNKA